MSSAVAMVGRNTAAALGIGALYLGVVENLIRAYRPAWQPWLVGDNLTVFIGTPQGFVPLAGRSMVGAGIVLVLYALGVAAVAGGVFRARDVT